MKKKLSPARAPLPRFQSDQAAADYFESHSAASVWDRLPEAPPAKPLPALAKKIRDRHARLKSPISLRLAARTDRRGEAHSGGEIGRLPDATPDVDCRGDPPGRETRIVPARGSVELANVNGLKRVYGEYACRRPLCIEA
jgi:hypothetical protein